MKKPDSMPNILSFEKTRKLIDTATNIKNHTVASTIYSCGQRISDVVK